MKSLKMIINAYARNLGWLFSDLQNLMGSLGCVVSETPIPNADAYICIRTKEFSKSPKPEKTLVQIHDLESYDLRGAGIISYCHPEQYMINRAKNHKTPYFIQPIGSRDIPVTPLPEKPVLGGFFREVSHKGRKQLKGSDLFAQAVEIARKEMDFDVLLIGQNLEKIAHLGTYEKRGALPDDYSRITALMTTSTSRAIPLSTYEALAAGRSIVSTPREFTFNVENIFWGWDAKTLADAIIKALNVGEIKPQKPYDRLQWAEKQVQEAIKLCVQR